MKDEVKEIFYNFGAALCGVAESSAFENAPEGFRPTDIYPGCKSVIVFANPIPKGTALVPPRLIYKHFNSLGPVELDRIAYLAANEIERRFGAVVVPIPSDNPYDSWNPDTLEGRGLISMKHAAVAAGLGQLGKSTMLLNEQYGSMLTLGAVLTDLELPADPPSGEVCIKGCHVCIDNCPAHAISENGVNQKKCRENTYAVNGRGFPVVNCNNCRTKCPMVFGRKRA